MFGYNFYFQTLFLFPFDVSFLNLVILEVAKSFKIELVHKKSFSINMNTCNLYISLYQNQCFKMNNFGHTRWKRIWITRLYIEKNNFYLARKKVVHTINKWTRDNEKSFYLVPLVSDYESGPTVTRLTIEDNESDSCGFVQHKCAEGSGF